VPRGLVFSLEWGVLAQNLVVVMSRRPLELSRRHVEFGRMYLEFGRMPAELSSRPLELSRGSISSHL